MRYVSNGRWESALLYTRSCTQDLDADKMLQNDQKLLAILF